MYNISNIFITKYGVQFLMYIVLNLNYMKNDGGGALAKNIKCSIYNISNMKGGGTIK